MSKVADAAYSFCRFLLQVSLKKILISTPKWEPIDTQEDNCMNEMV